MKRKYKETLEQKAKIYVYEINEEKNISEKEKKSINILRKISLRKKKQNNINRQ